MVDEARTRSSAQRRRRAIPLLAVVAVLAVQHLGPAPAAAAVFSNPTPIDLPAPGPGNPAPTRAIPYPSSITVSGMSGTVTDVNLTLHGLDCSAQDPDFAYPEDLDIMLEGPTGANVVVLSDVGGDNLSPTPLQFTDITVTLDDEAANALPSDARLSSGTYRPLDDDSDPDEQLPVDTFPTPAPAPSDATALSVFDGTAPNGTWNLWVTDDWAGPNNCDILRGWSIDIETTGGGGPTTTSSTSTSLPPATTTSTTSAANQAPVAVDDTYTTAQGVTLTVPAPGVLANDSDPDGDPIIVGMSTNPSNGTLILGADGGFTYVPNQGFSGTDSFTYMAHDPSDAMSGWTTVTITVTPAATTTSTSSTTTSTSSTTTSTSSTTTSTPASTTTSTSSTTTSTPASTTTSTPASTTTSTPASTTTSTPAPGGPIQIDDLVLSDGNVARVTGTMTCEAGHRFRMRVDLTQGDTEARAIINGTCTGEPQRFRAIVQVMRGPGLQEGTASVRATAQVGDPDTRDIEDRFQTTEEVEIDIPGAMTAAMLSAIHNSMGNR